MSALIDLRSIKSRNMCVSEEDIAKRLIDYGFHAPTNVLAGCRNFDGRAHRKRKFE
jgi:aconitase A